MMRILDLCSQRQTICLYSVFRAKLRIAISAPTTRSQLRPLTSGSSTPRACNQRPQCYGLDVFAARSAQFRTKYRAICHQLCASSIYAVDSNRSAYTPCSAQYCASPSAHQRRALSVGVAGLRLKRTASLQSAPALHMPCPAAVCPHAPRAKTKPPQATAPLKPRPAGICVIFCYDLPWLERRLSALHSAVRRAHFSAHTHHYLPSTFSAVAATFSAVKPNFLNSCPAGADAPK